MTSLSDCGPGSGPAREPDRAALVALALDKLGPASAARIEGSELVAARAELDAGHDPTDAVLAEAFACLPGDREVSAEFFGYFWDQLPGILPTARFASLRRFVETGDLAVSVFGDVVEKVDELRFEGRRPFLALLRQRLRWKAYHQVRKSRTTPTPSGEAPLEAPATANGPQAEAEQREQSRRVALAVGSLHPRDRTLVALFLEGAASQDLAEAIGVNQTAGRQALHRALQRLRVKLQEPGTPM